MPDRPFPAAEALIRRVQRVAANRPDPWYIFAQAIGMSGAIGVDPYAVLGVLVEGAVQTLIRQIPAKRQAETAAMLVELLEERLKAHRVPGGDSMIWTIGSNSRHRGNLALWPAKSAEIDQMPW
jgi:hypothetical protein